MKTVLLCLAAACAALPLANAASNKPANTEPERAEVVFIAPEKFTDVRDSYTGTDDGRDDILNQLRQYLIDNVRSRLAPGERLFVSVTDVDLAGDYEPWVGPRWDDVRIVKDIYPPRIDLTFRLVDANGQTVKEGKRELRDLGFLMKIGSTFRDDPLRHEKTLLADWLSNEFRRRGNKA